jgi:hypothetical protein
MTWMTSVFGPDADKVVPSSGPEFDKFNEDNMNYLEATAPTGFAATRTESLMEGATDVGTKVLKSKCPACFGGTAEPAPPPPPPEEPLPPNLESQMYTPVGDGLEVPRDIGDF